MTRDRRDKSDEDERPYELISFGAEGSKRSLAWVRADRARQAVLRADHSRALVAGLALVTVIALMVAGAGWLVRSPAEAPAAASPDFESHGLDADQAACFAFARIERRVTIILGGETPLDFGPMRRTFTHEVAQLDRLSDDYPKSDYRLIVAFNAVGDSSIEYLASDDPTQQTDLGNARFYAMRDARAACEQIAGFDIRAAAPF